MRLVNLLCHLVQYAEEQTEATAEASGAKDLAGGMVRAWRARSSVAALPQGEVGVNPAT